MKSSSITKIAIAEGEAIRAGDVREGIFNLLRVDFPNIKRDDYISLDELNLYRRRYLTSLISTEKGELAVIDQDVLDAIQKNSILSENIQEEIEAELTTGQKLADKVAAFGGSWFLLLRFFHSF
ncbi:hypothetical protein ACFX5U_08900 [Sphingobacterium sp. SG20118]|uniref:hypothetical protein n=1 Tax=Sphingobacterium sp. SG20118 TaxID=3367156 RepID=UPI0037DFC213